MSTPSPPPPSAAPIAAAMPPSEAAPAPPAPLTAATAATAAASPAAVADEPQEGECEASARLAAYMDAPLPYTPEDWQRVNCDGCRHNKRFYCPTCLCVLGAPAHVAVPQLALPIRVDLVLADDRKKSSGIQAAVMATTSIHIHSFPKELHDGWDPQRTLVLYPADDAVTLDELDPQDLAGVERLVLIDSRWNNTTRVLEHESIKRLTRKVKLRTAPRTSRFWRYHNKGEGHVSSVEALYYLLKEYEALTGKGATWLSPPEDGNSSSSSTGQELQPRPQQPGAAPLEELFFLFRLQSRLIKAVYDRDDDGKGIPAPMDEEGKTRLRSFRCFQRLAKEEAKKARGAWAAEQLRRHRGEGAGGGQQQQQKRQRQNEGDEQQ